MRKYVEQWDKAWCHTTLFHVGQNVLQLWSTKNDLIIFFETFCFFWLGILISERKISTEEVPWTSHRHRVRHLDLMDHFASTDCLRSPAWWLCLPLELGELSYSCRCFGTLAASLCDRLMAVIVCFYMLKTIMKGSEKGASSNILCQLSCILGNSFCMCIICLFRFF